MENLMEDALLIKKYLPWINSDEEIIQFLRRIPLQSIHSRIPIAMKYFFNLKDNNSVLTDVIEDEAKEIVSILPNYSISEVKKRLNELGNINNRKEVIFRILLKDREDLEPILDQIKTNLSGISTINAMQCQEIEGHLCKKKRKVVEKSNCEIPNIFNHFGTHNENIKKFQAEIILPTSISVSSNFPNISQSQEYDMKPFQTFLRPLPLEEISDTLKESNVPSTSHIDDFPDNNLQLPSTECIRVMSEELKELDHLEDTPPSNKEVDEQLVSRLLEIFPESCPDYIRNVSENKKWPDFDELVTIILENVNHPKRRKLPEQPMPVDLEEQFETVKALLPDADPEYLRMQCDTLDYNPKELNKFIIEARETKNYPTMKDFLRNQQLSAQCKQYTTEFNVQNFLNLFPEPHLTFKDPKRVVDVDNYSKLYIKQYFENKFDRLPKKAISNILLKNNYKILNSNEELLLINNSTLKMKSKRKHILLNNNIKNILVLQELAYMEHKNEIEESLKAKLKIEEEDRRYAKENGLMNTCQCCFDDEVMPKDTFYCSKECLFCRSCIKKSCEIVFGEGRTDFKCLNDCSEQFSLQTLQSTLPPKMFSKIVQKKMITEIKAAGIDELEMCPFCDFAIIPNEGDKIFKCLNSDCMKESCRSCKEPNHIPLHCDEIEKDENVKARTFIENKMTEALLCQCWKCGTSFFKEEGCNKMTCTCGAQMCYVCKQPVEDYKHFNGVGGNKYHLCPLFSDTNNLNHQNVSRAMNSAKAQIDQSKLKFDPSVKLEEYFENRAQQLPKAPHFELLQNIELRRQFLHRNRRNPLNF